MSTKGEVRREASVPAQSRIDIRTLCQLTKYWYDTGVFVKSVSQLISWSLESFHEVLRINGKTGEKPTVEEAEFFLSSLGLMTRGMKTRKLLVAKSSEELKLGGSSLQREAPAEYSALHSNKTWTQDGAEEQIDRTINKPAWDIDEITKKYKEISREDDLQRGKDEIAEVMATAVITVCEKTGEKIITPQGTPKSVVGPDQQEAYLKREEGRDRLEKIDKRDGVLDRRERKLKDELYLIEQEDKENEDAIRRGERSSDESEEDGADSCTNIEGDG